LIAIKPNYLAINFGVLKILVGKNENIFNAAFKILV